uniref:Uncharacterized protein n=1 Tax=Calcidiscus leptoporus TaxID=127549 RepID=A0A7S0JHL1_9EUKA
MPLSTATKTVLASLAGATIAIPSSLPFALFSLDFGKEGAAVLSSILSAVGFSTSLVVLRHFPKIIACHGWFGVHAILAAFGGLAATSMSAIMFSDQRKFSRGYIIRSSLVNESVLVLHACSRDSCAHHPMWRPGSRRVWGPSSGGHPPWQLHAPNRRCHHCGRSELLFCKVGEAAAELALITPFSKCTSFVREQAPLKKPPGGWDFADPLRFPLAPATTYGDRKSYEARLRRELMPAAAEAEPKRTAPAPDPDCSADRSCIGPDSDRTQTVNKGAAQAENQRGTISSTGPPGHA